MKNVWRPDVNHLHFRRKLLFARIRSEILPDSRSHFLTRPSIIPEIPPPRYFLPSLLSHQFVSIVNITSLIYCRSLNIETCQFLIFPWQLRSLPGSSFTPIRGDENGKNCCIVDPLRANTFMHRREGNTRALSMIFHFSPLLILLLWITFTT